MGKFSLQKNDECAVSREDAERQFMLFIEFYDLDLDKCAGNVSDATGKTITSDTLGDEYVDLIMDGKMSIENSDDSVTVIQHLSKPLGEIDTIKYGVIRGRNRKDMAKAEQLGRTAMIMELLGSLTSSSSKIIEKLVGNDVQIALNIGQLYFLA